VHSIENAKEVETIQVVQLQDEMPMIIMTTRSLQS